MQLTWSDATTSSATLGGRFIDGRPILSFSGTIDPYGCRKFGFACKPAHSRMTVRVLAPDTLRSPLTNDGESQAEPDRSGREARRGSRRRIGRTLRIRVMDIGKPRRTHTVEPLEDPVPRELPEESPEREEPAEPPREPEQVPA